MLVFPVGRRRDSISFGPLRKDPGQHCIRICTMARKCMCRRENGGALVIYMCLSTNIEIFSFIFNITGANATLTPLRRGYKYARCARRRLTLASSSTFLGGCGIESKDEARDEFAAHGSANTGFHQDRIQIGNMFTLKTFRSVRLYISIP